MKKKTKRGGHRLNAGRPKGSLNKSNQEIKDIIDRVCDFEKLVASYYKHALRGNVKCGKLLFEYRYGKPPQPLTGDPNHPLQSVVRVIFDEPS